VESEEKSVKSLLIEKIFLLVCGKIFSNGKNFLIMNQLIKVFNKTQVFYQSFSQI